MLYYYSRPSLIRVAWDQHLCVQISDFMNGGGTDKLTQQNSYDMVGSDLFGEV